MLSHDDLKDGWTAIRTTRIPNATWVGFLKDSNFRFPVYSDKINIELKQDKPFHKVAGELVKIEGPMIDAFRKQYG